MAWLSGWQYRKSHDIEGSTAGAVTDYQVKIVVHYGSGTDSGEAVYLNGKCRSDFADIRFTSADGSTLLAYWAEEVVDSDHAVFWVNIPSIPAEPDSTTIYIYYGNSNATSASDGKNTFLKFYDFESDESSEWVLDTGTWQWDTANGWLRLQTGNAEDRARISGYTPGTGIAVRVRMYGTDTPDPNADPGVIIAYQDANNFYMARINTGQNEVQLYKKVSGSFTKIGSNSKTLATNTWYVLEAAWPTTNRLLVFLDDELQINQTTSLESWSSGYVGVRDYQSESRYDFFLVRKYVYPEPSHGAWGPEETSAIIVTDSGSGADACILAVKHVILSDSGTGADQFSLGKTVSDSGTGAEIINIYLTKIVQDLASALDYFIVVSKTEVISDAGVATDRGTSILPTYEYIQVKPGEFFFSITVPPNTSKQRPQRAHITLRGRRLEEIAYLIPPGWAALAGFALYYGAERIYPDPNADWVTGDNLFRLVKLNIKLPERDTRIELVMYNDDDTYPHTLYLWLKTSDEEMTAEEALKIIAKFLRHVTGV